MKRSEAFLENAAMYHTAYARTNQKIYQLTTLTEQDIITLHNLFLTPGIHTITVPSLLVGRELIYIFLDSLASYYHQCAALADQSIPLRISIMDIERLFDHSREEFFTENFHADFLWIEATDTIQSLPIFAQLEQTLRLCKVDRDIPIITVLYR